MSTVLRAILLVFFVAGSSISAKEQSTGYTFWKSTFFPNCGQGSKNTCKGVVFVHIQTIEVALREGRTLPPDVYEFLQWPRVSYLESEYIRKIGNCDYNVAVQDLRKISENVGALNKSSVYSIPLSEGAFSCFSPIKEMVAYELFVFEKQVIGDTKCYRDVNDRFRCDLEFFRRVYQADEKTHFIGQSIAISPVYSGEINKLLTNFDLGIEAIPRPINEVDQQAFEWLERLLIDHPISIIIPE